MKKLYFTLFLGIFLIFSGCAQPGLEEVDSSSTNYIAHYETGTIISIKNVAIKDSGTGTFLGGLIGAVLGSTIGRGRGSVLASLGGGLAGAYVGNQVGKANAQELTIDLDNGENIVVITKGLKHFTGEHVRIVKRGSRIISVERY